MTVRDVPTHEGTEPGKDAEPREDTGRPRLGVAGDRPAVGAVPVAWLPVGAVAAGMSALLFGYANRYGYHADELYFRLLGERGPTLGYVDQPPLLPMVVRGSIAVFGDSLWAIRVPAVLCAAAVVVLGAMLAAEFGGRRAAQVFTALGLASSVLVLSIGHFILTSSVDTVAWCAMMLFVLRALLRGDGRWWLAAGAVCGVAMYAKYIIVLLPIALLLGLALVGPRAVFRDRNLYLGMALALVLGAPNVGYQVSNDFPQLQMAGALGELDGTANRTLFVSNLVFLLGPGLVAFWVAGLIGTFREPDWRPVRALGVGYLLATAAALVIEGGRPDYTAGFLIALFAAGATRAARWWSRRGWRLPLVAAGVTVTAVLQMLLALPAIPERSLAEYPINSMALETVGWPAFVVQVGRAYQALPADERDRTVILVENFGEAGALDRFADRYRLPTVYSGHNELHNWGPPPDSATAVLAVGVDAQRLRADFATCTTVSTVDNGLGIENAEYGKAIMLCRDRNAPWSALWPKYRHLGAYM